MLENLEMGAFVRADDVADTLSQVLELFPVLREEGRSACRRAVWRPASAGGCWPGSDDTAKVLMLDEPTAGVSPIVMDELFDRIIEVARTGIAILMVEQNAKQALHIADKGFVLVQGRNRYTDTGQALLADNDVRKAFLGG